MSDHLIKIDRSILISSFGPHFLGVFITGRHFIKEMVVTM